MKLNAFLKLIRWPNLLVIIASMYFFRSFMVLPLFEQVGQVSSLNSWEFLLITLATVLIAAAGNIVNDYFDIDIDSYNKKDGTIILRFITKENAFKLYSYFNVAAIILASVVAWKFRDFQLLSIFVIAVILLWFYSSTLKRKFLIGNVVIAILCALPFLVVIIFERSLFEPDGSKIQLMLASTLFTQLFGYMFFAFYATLIRELVKDLEDREGDDAYGAKTLAVVSGFKTTKVIVAILTMLFVIPIVWIMYLYEQGNMHLHLLYSAIFILVPVFISWILTVKAKREENFILIGNIWKSIMVLGILTLPVFHYINQYLSS